MNVETPKSTPKGSKKNSRLTVHATIYGTSSHSIQTTQQAAEAVGVGEVEME